MSSEEIAALSEWIAEKHDATRFDNFWWKSSIRGAGRYARACTGVLIAMQLLRELLDKGYCLMQVGGGFWIGWPKDAANNGRTKRIEDSLELAIAVAWKKAHQ